jgi:8-oxo-dGTP pyrophosphatase MutT (NUDIX family)
MPALPGRRNHLPAAVLVPIYWDPSPKCVLTLRQPNMRAHAGEVCFPGGQPDEADGELIETALREAREEIGLTKAEVLGSLSSIPLYTSDYRLHPFVAAIDKQDFSLNAAEVARVICGDIVKILDQKHIHAIAWTHRDIESLSPVFVIEECVCYGATAYVLFELLTMMAPLLGCEVPPLQTGRFTWQDVLPPDFEA